MYLGKVETFKSVVFAPFMQVMTTTVDHSVLNRILLGARWSWGLTSCVNTAVFQASQNTVTM